MKIAVYLILLALASCASPDRFRMDNDYWGSVSTAVNQQLTHKP